MEKLEQTRMSDNYLKARIEKDADEYVKQYLPHVDTTGHWLGFQDGALSERPKAWNEAIDKAQEKFIESTHLKWTPIEAWELLEKLKHKQP